MKHFKVYLSALVGSTLEYYDYKLFVYLAPLLSTLFFPKDDPASALFKTFGISFIGTLAKPLGAYLFGKIGDIKGRKIALSYSIILMALASAAITYMPTYAQIGISATFFITICRLVQSMSSAGELTGSAIFIIEHVGSKRAGLASGLVLSFSVLGILLASLTSRICVTSQNPEFNWRYCFAAGILIGLLGFFIRKYTYESREYFQCVQETKTRQAKQQNVLIQYLGVRCIACILLAGTAVSLYYFAFVFLGAYLPLIRSDIVVPTSMRLTNSLLFVYMFVSLGSGWLSDYISPRKIMACALIGVLAFIIPLSNVVFYGSLSALFKAQIILTILAGIFIGPLQCLLTTAFPTAVRYRYASVCYSIGSSLLGASTPLICIQLCKTFKLSILPMHWIALTTLLGLLALSMLPTTNTRGPIFKWLWPQKAIA